MEQERPAPVRWYVFLVVVQVFLPWFVLNDFGQVATIGLSAAVAAAVWLRTYAGWAAALLLAAVTAGLRLWTLITTDSPPDGSFSNRVRVVVLMHVVVASAQLALLSTRSTRRWVAQLRT